MGKKTQISSHRRINLEWTIQRHTQQWEQDKERSKKKKNEKKALQKKRGENHRCT
jgi:hypothetical protein